MEQVMGAVRKKARVHRLLTRNEEDPAVSGLSTTPALPSASSSMPTSLPSDTRPEEQRSFSGDSVIHRGNQEGGADSMDVDDGGGGASSGAKRKLSRFERKRLKKMKGKGNEGDDGKGIIFGDGLPGMEVDDAGGDVGSSVIGKNGPGRFADKAFYIGYGTT